MNNTPTLHKKLCNQYDFEVTHPIRADDTGEYTTLFATMMLSTEANLPESQLSKISCHWIEAIADTIPNQVELEFSAKYAFHVDVNKARLKNA